MKLLRRHEQPADEHVQEATFLESLKDQTKDRTEPGPNDIVLRDAPGNGNLQLVQMVCHGEFEVSTTIICLNCD